MRSRINDGPRVTNKCLVDIVPVALVLTYQSRCTKFEVSTYALIPSESVDIKAVKRSCILRTHKEIDRLTRIKRRFVCICLYFIKRSVSDLPSICAWKRIFYDNGIAHVSSMRKRMLRLGSS